jgi:hypothetical protein
MDEVSNERIVKIENLLKALTENMVAAEEAAVRRQAEWKEMQADWAQKQADWEKRQDRMDRRVALFARAGLAEVRRNRKEHDAFDERMNSISKNLDIVGLRLNEMTDKLDAIIKIEQDRQPPQQ